MIFQKDKQKHFLVGMILSLIFVWVSPLAAILVVMFVGITKEVYDSTGRGCVDVWDLVATIYGGLPIPIVVEIYKSLAMYF